MTNAELIQAIRNEIERLKDENRKIKCQANERYCSGYDDAFYDLVPFIDTLELEKPINLGGLEEEKSAIDLIVEERKRQISKGFNWRHDDEHNCHQLSDAAIVYATPGPLRYQVMNWWPWDKKWLKEDDSFTTEGRIRELIKAGALIVAEIERLQRTINNYDKKDNPWELGQDHIAPDGTKLIVCQPERDGSGCMVCDGCWYLNNKKQCPCPNCRGPFVWIDSSWGVIFRTPEQVKKDSLPTLETEKPMQEGLEEEIDRFEDWMETYNQSDYPTSYTTRDIARHFAQWGAEHLKK